MSVIRPDRTHGTGQPARPARLLASVRSELRLIPTVSVVGLIVIAFGLGADLVAHTGAAFEHDHGATGAQLSAHFVTFVGMVVVLGGVVVDGLRTTLRR
jgi:hypothetical protein